MESKNPEAALSLLESGRESTFSYQAEREQLEHLRSRIRVLESENIELKRLQPRLIDARGKDCTSEFSKLVKELQIAKNNCEDWENEHRKLLKNHTELEQSALMQIDQRDKELGEIKRNAMELEEENSKLREQIHDERSKIHMMPSNKYTNHSIGEQQFEACMRQLYQESMSTTPSFAGLGITQQSEVSIAECANATVESMNAMNLAGRTANLAEVCIQMFGKLRGTAEFFQQLLNKFDVSVDEVGEDLLRKIVSMKLDLDKSMGEARCIVDEAKNAEKNIRSFLLEQSQISMNSTAFDEPEKNILKGRIAELEQMNEEKEHQLMEKKIHQEKIDELEQIKLKLEEEKEHQLMEKKIHQEKIDELEQIKLKLEEEKEQQLMEKKILKEKIVELEQMKLKLEEEKEQMSSSIKENQMIPRTQLVEGIRGELGKIYDTMSFATSRLNSNKALVPSQKSNMKKKNANKPAAGTSSQQEPL